MMYKNEKLRLRDMYYIRAHYHSGKPIEPTVEGDPQGSHARVHIPISEGLEELIRDPSATVRIPINDDDLDAEPISPIQTPTQKL